MKTSFISSFALKAFLFAFLCVSSSCSKKGDPIPYVELPANALGVFAGDLVYGLDSFDGKGTITKTGDKTYSVSFSDGVPSISNLKFVGANGGFSSAGDDGSTAGVSLSATSMNVGAKVNGKDVAFAGKK